MGIGKYTHARTCVYNANYHIVWCVKYRRKVLTEPISARLYELLEQSAKDNGFHIVEMKTGEMDHVHCFVSAPPKVSITQIVRCLKGSSAHRLLMEYPELRKSLRHGSLWNGSYFAETIGSTNEENLKWYIERQKSVQR
jgi:putative transposase